MNTNLLRSASGRGYRVGAIAMDLIVQIVPPSLLAQMKTPKASNRIVLANRRVIDSETKVGTVRPPAPNTKECYA
jgi:hypothetical protein